MFDRILDACAALYVRHDYPKTLCITLSDMRLLMGDIDGTLHVKAEDGHIQFFIHNYLEVRLRRLITPYGSLDVEVSDTLTELIGKNGKRCVVVLPTSQDGEE